MTDDDGGTVDFRYSNLSGRPTGPVVSALSRVLRGVREVQEHVEPYAHHWERVNAASVQQVAAGARWWAVLGDSMSQGIGASAADRGWVGQLATRVDLPIVNLSFNGARIDDVLGRQLPAMEDLALAHRNRPALVTLMVGNNDMNSRSWRRQIPTAMPDLLRRLPRGTVVATQPGAQGSALMVNEAIDVAARDGRVRVAEFRVPDMRSWRGRLAADHFHPNDTGYAAMATIIARALDL
ncbi:SGNH/GDSL hydrolase family protein [Aeromicrobium sp. CF4.19]|uniref:SGNH/GDSL hydrolase family protein n=1 Tax=Aeromicrobium sp. CF4.19 TaxID=3373082 RepID=UPI003EE5ECB4